MNDYFIHCTDENLISFANALSYQTGEHATADETPKDVIQRHCGSDSVEQVWENKKFVAMLSTEGTPEGKFQVLNIVEKKDDRTMQSYEVN